MTTDTAPSRAATPTDAQVPHAFRRLVLTGFMGAGKTTVGRQLAAELGWLFVDLDERISERSGLSVAQIFAELGEARFRRLESAALASALRRDRVVLALGGGAPETLTNRLLLEQTPGTVTVLLDAPFPVLFDRCMLEAVLEAAERPNLKDPTAAEARYAARLPLYRRLAGVTVSTESLDAAGVARSVREALSALR